VAVTFRNVENHFCFGFFFFFFLKKLFWEIEYGVCMTQSVTGLHSIVAQY
jgi:hypothetical protein